MQLFRVMTNTLNDHSVHEYIVMAENEQEAADIARGNARANNPDAGLQPPQVSQNNTRVLSVQRPVIFNCIERTKFPLSMARDLQQNL